jgi:hypothetical protein
MEPTKLAVYVETDETTGSCAQEVYDVLGTHLPAGIVLVNVESATEDEQDRQRPRSATATGEAAGARPGSQPVSTTAHGINLAARFRPDEEAVRDLIGHAITAYDNDEIPADDAPVFGATWNPCGDSAASTVRQLVRYAADHGAIVRPEGADLAFVYVPGDEDSPDYYYFTVTIGHHYAEQLILSSQWSEMRKLVDGETGADAAMSILGEAVARANHILDRLAVLLTSHGAAITAATA